MQLDDAGVAARPSFLARSDFVEEDLHGIFLMKTGCRETAVVKGAALAEGDHLFRNGSRGFRLGQRGGDSLVDNQAADQIRQHRVAMCRSAAEFCCSFTMTHGISSA